MDGKKFTVLHLRLKLLTQDPLEWQRALVVQEKGFIRFSKKFKKNPHTKCKHITREKGKNILQDAKNYYARK